MKYLKDLTGQVFGLREVIRKGPPDSYGATRWWCKCKCGRVDLVANQHLIAGHRGACKSCSMKGHQNALKHGHCAEGETSGIYKSWASMKWRCYSKNEESSSYRRKGIQVCDRWKNSFIDFLADMKSTWFPGATIDRIDNDGNYTPENCQWLTANENRSKKGGRKYDT